MQLQSMTQTLNLDALGSLGCWKLARSGKEGRVGGVLTLTYVVVS